MKKSQNHFVFYKIKLSLILVPLFSFNPEIFSHPGSDEILSSGLKCELNQDTTHCGDQTFDTLQKIARFDHTEEGSDFYYVRLSLFHSQSERLSFYEKARDRGIYIDDKNNFYSDSALFIATFDKEQASLEFLELYRQAEENSLTVSESDKKNLVRSSPFYKAAISQKPETVYTPSSRENECTGANVACSANTYTFPAGTSGSAPPSVDGYPNYGCLGSTPCPAWYYMQVGVVGDIVITISQSGNHDVDFICWGPFTSLTDGCAYGLTGTCSNNPLKPPVCCNNTSSSCQNFYPRGNITDCSYSPNATETCHILNAQVGEMYILLITNFSQQPGTITFSQTGGSGVTNCNIVVFCSMLAITTNTSVCDPFTNTFSVSGNIEFSNPSPTGTLTITDNTAVPTVTQTFSPPFTSPLAYNLTNIPCDGATHSLTAVFSDSLNCALTQAFTAPEATCPSGVISGGGAICDNGTSQAIVLVDIAGSPGPYSFTYAINGINQSPVTNYSGPLPYQIITNIPGLYNLVSISNQVCPAGGTITGTATVTLNPLPVPIITGPASPCLNVPVQYSTEDLMTGYTWSVSPSGTIQSGQGTRQVQVLWTAVGSRTISVNYVDPNGCTAVSPTTMNINVNTLPVPTISGDNPVCERVISIYTTEPGEQSYSWILPTSGVTIISGGEINDNTVTIQWNTAGSYSIGVNYINSNGCTAIQPTTFPVTVKPSPTPTFVQGTPDLCEGTTGVVYSTQTGMSNYAWAVSPGGTVTAGGTLLSSSVTISWIMAGTQTVTVNYVNADGCTALNPTVYNVTVNPLPVATFTGTYTVCQLHPDPYSYTADPGPVCNYAWSVIPASYGTISDAKVNPAAVTWNIAGNALVRLDAVTGSGCTSFSSHSIQINPRPEVSITACFDPVTSRSAKPFILKGGKPLLTGSPQQGEYLINPATTALYYNNGNYYFDPSIVPGNIQVTYSVSYKYTNQYNCPATTATTILLTVRGPNPACGSSMTDYRDGTSYRTSLVAGKCWMMENLRYGSTLVPTTIAQTDNCTTERYCLSSDVSCSTYGGLYQWDELIQYGQTSGPDYQGVCPPGWHVPSSLDWQNLINASGGNGLAAGPLTDLNLIPEGFEALLKGVYYMNTTWAFTVNDLPKGTMFWTSTPGSGSKIITRSLNSINASVSLYESSKVNAFPVRCVKD